MGDSEEALFQNLLKKLDELKTVLEIPKTIKEALGEKVSEQEFLDSVDKMSRDAFDDQCTGANPRYPLVREIKEMYLRAYYGKNMK